MAPTAEPNCSSKNLGWHGPGSEAEIDRHNRISGIGACTLTGVQEAPGPSTLNPQLRTLNEATRWSTTLSVDFHQKSTCITLWTVGPYVVQI